MTNVNEIWLPVKGYEGYYEVSNTGLVRSVERLRSVTLKGEKHKYTIKPKILSAAKNARGYLFVSISNTGLSGGYNSKVIHRLVAEAFVPNIKSKPFVNHIDGNKLNNNASNLEWCTNAENIQHAYRIGLIPKMKGVKNKNCKLREKDVLDIYNSEASCVALAKVYSVGKSMINYIKSGKNWKHITQRLPA